MSTSKDVKLMSLDDYIKKRGIDEQFDLFSFRKSKFVDLSLNELVKEKSKLDLKNKVEKGRFDRPSLRDNSDNESDGDEEIDSEHRAVEDDVEMKDESNEHINSYETQLNPDNCDQIERFTTVEQLNNIKVSSQAWRLENQNVIIDRPKNMPHLTTLGSTIRQDNINRVQSGKVNKGYKNHYSDFVSNFKNVKTGKFVEKGGFTYKHDNNGLIGIDRQKKTEQNIQQNAIGAPQINIHMDWNGLFNQMKDVKQATPVIVTQQPKKDVVTPQQLSRISSFSSNSEVPTDISKLKFAAADLIEFLKSKKSKKTITFT